MSVMRLSQKIGVLILSVAGLYLGAAAVRYVHSVHHAWNLAGFALTLPGLLRHDPRLWKIFLSVLFAAQWMYFWIKLQSFIESPVPSVVAAISLVAFALPPLSGYHAFQPAHSFGGWLYSLVVLLSSRCLRIGTMTGFFPILGANVLVLIASFLGLERVHPIDAQLRKRTLWPKRVRHGGYPEKAIRKGLTYLGWDVTRKHPIFLSPSERNTHVHVVGTTGSGKTLFALFPMLRQDIEAGRGVVFIDAKGSSDNAAAIYQMVTQAGREKDFVLFSLTQTDLASTYNPLQHGNPSQLKDKIAASIEWSEPYYQRICENALQAIFMDLGAIGRRATLPDLREILRNPPAQLPNFALLAERHVRDIRTLSSEIDLLVNTPFGGLFAEQAAAIDLLDIYRNGKIAYFGLDTQSYQHTAARVGKMITQDLNTLSGIVESTFRSSDKRPLAVYIDEFQAFGTRGFINALARGRSSGFWITIAHQSLGDLKAVDQAFAQQVMENTNTKIVLRTNDPETAQLFADSVGTVKTVETTSQVRIEGEDPKNIMGSQSVTYEYRVHPNEFKNLDPGQAIFKSGKRFARIVLNGHFPKDAEAIAIPKSAKPTPRPFAVMPNVRDSNLTGSDTATGEQLHV